MVNRSLLPNRWLSLIAASALVTVIPVSAAPDTVALPAGVERITSVEGVTEYRLANGLGVLLFPDPSKPTITVNITYKVGSRHEGYGETGMAHLLEHLLFKGTPNHPDIPAELSQRGAHANGTTWFDRTNYFERVDASDENLRWALELEADRMINSHVAKRDLESEFSVVRNEYERGENSPGSVLYKRMLPTVFQWHNYGHSTIGEKSDIEGAPIERLQAFYRTYYQPDNAVLVVAGKIDEQKTLGIIAETFGKIPKPTRQLVATYTKEPIQDGEREITLRRVGDVQLFSCMYRGASGAHPDYAALSVLSVLLTDEPTGRLYKALVDGKKAATVSGGASGYAEAGFINFVAEVRMEQSLEDARKTMLGVLDDLRKSPPTEEEVQRAKTRLLKNFEMLLKQSERLGITLSEYIAMGDWRLALLHRDQIEKVTNSDVARVAQHYFKAANRTVGSFIPESSPERAEIPDPPDLTALLKDYQGKGIIAAGEDFDASPPNIEKRTTRTQLANGMRIAFLPRETRGDSVTASLTFRFGTLESLRGQATVGAFVAALIDRGTQGKKRQEIKDLLDRLKARLSVGGGASNVTAFIETDREHLADVIRLLGEILRQPAFPEAEFENYRQEYLANIEQQKSEPTSLGWNLYGRLSRPHYSPGDLRYTMTFDEEAAAAKAVTRTHLQEFHRTFIGATHATASVVGDFDHAAIEKVLQETFGDWKSPGEFQRIATPYEPATARVESISTPDKANAIYIAGYGFSMRDDNPDYPAVAISGYMLGGGFLHSRLATRIRQKEGLSYSVRGGFSASALDPDAAFSAYMIYNPTNLSKLEAAFREEIERASKDGFTADELAEAKTGWLSSRKVSRSGDGAVAGILNTYLFIGRDFHWDARHEAAVGALTLEQVNAAARKYLDHARLIVVKAGDFKAAPAKTP